MRGNVLFNAAQLKGKLIPWLAILTVIVSFFYVAQPVTAAVIVASGQVTDQANAPLAGVQIDCLTGENNQGSSSIATADASGNYSCSIEGSSLADGTPVSIQPRSFEGYRSAQTQNFIWSGTTQTINFQYQIAAKTVNISVFYEDGQLVDNVQVTAQPINLVQGESASQVQEDFANGSGDLSMSGGEWIVKADANFSETNAERYPWISITAPIKVEFANDSTAESVDLEFVVARSEQKVQVTLLDASGVALNSGMVGDAYFEGFSGKYGSISTSRKVNPTTGLSELYLLPGVWKVSALDAQLTGQSFDPATATFVVSDEPGTHNIGTIQASVNVGQLSGTVTVGGVAMSNVEVVASNVDNGNRTTGNTGATGEFSMANVAYGTYAITVNNNSYIPTQSATATLTAANPTAEGLAIEVEVADTIITGSIVDVNNAVIENVPGTVVVKGETVEFTAPVEPDGSFELKISTADLPDDQMQLQFVPQPGAEVFASETVAVPVNPNSMVQANISTSTDEASISGNITNFSGEQLDTELGDKSKIMAMDPTSGAVETADVAADGSFELMVGPGEWTLVPQLNDTEATVLPQNTSSISVDVVAGDAKTTDVPMYVEAGTVEVTVTDPNGAAVVEAPVLFTNLPALQAAALETGDPVDQNKIIQIA
ncbi:MAG: hypothetical protein ACD_43C00268G0002, partial [uncultured bacterium]